jgi:hypothetical protein
MLRVAAVLPAVERRPLRRETLFRGGRFPEADTPLG